jgi:hypothetical protein
MKASELIASLHQIIQTEGDFEVICEISEFNGHATYTVDEIRSENLHSHMLDDDFDMEVAEKFFPECEGDYEKFEEIDKEVPVINIYAGSRIYVT